MGIIHMCSVKGLMDTTCNFYTCPKELNTTDLLEPLRAYSVMTYNISDTNLLRLH